MPECISHWEKERQSSEPPQAIPGELCQELELAEGGGQRGECGAEKVHDDVRK